MRRRRQVLLLPPRQLPHTLPQQTMQLVRLLLVLLLSSATLMNSVVPEVSRQSSSFTYAARRSHLHRHGQMACLLTRETQQCAPTPPRTPETIFQAHARRRSNRTTAQRRPVPRCSVVPILPVRHLAATLVLTSISFYPRAYGIAWPISTEIRHRTITCKMQTSA